MSLTKTEATRIIDNNNLGYENPMRQRIKDSLYSLREGMSDFSEKHPRIVKAAPYVGAATLMIGGGLLGMKESGTIDFLNSVSYKLVGGNNPFLLVHAIPIEAGVKLDTVHVAAGLLSELLTISGAYPVYKAITTK
jgi:hypothetical protein